MTATPLLSSLGFEHTFLEFAKEHFLTSLYSDYTVFEERVGAMYVDP